MLYEMKGIIVKKFVIIMTCEDGEVKVYEERDKSKYINLLSEYIREFVEDKLQSISLVPRIKNSTNSLRVSSTAPQRFIEEIEKLVHTSKEMKYVDVIIHFCEKNNLDVESVPKLISKPLKEKIKSRKVMEMNLLKGTSHVPNSVMIPKVTDYEVYKTYLGISRHFTTESYDYQKYCGKVRCSL